MRIVLLLSACALAPIMWSIAIGCVAHRNDLRRVDYQLCTPVHNGPIRRSYNAHPFGSKGSNV